MPTTQTTLADLAPGFPVVETAPAMQVRKRNGSLELTEFDYTIPQATERSGPAWVALIPNVARELEEESEEHSCGMCGPSRQGLPR